MKYEYGYVLVFLQWRMMGLKIENLIRIYNIIIKIRMATVQEILKQQDRYSDLSIDASFTLEDILQEPPDEDVQIFNNLDQIDDLDAYFQDEEPQKPQQQELPPQTNDLLAENLNSQKSMQKEPDLIKQSSSNMPNADQLSQRPRKQSQFKPLGPVRRWARLQDLPLPASDQIRNMVYIALKNVSDLFDITNSQTKGVGVPTCISSTGSKFLAIGTSLGNIVVFQIGVKGHKTLSTADQNNYRQVTSISVSRDNRYLIAGYESGLVILWDLYSYKLSKTVLLQKNRILKVLFCGQNFENFISSDAQGYIYMYTIENYLWTGVKSQLLIDKSDNIYYDVKYSKVKSGRQIIALSTFNSVLLISLKPNIAVIGSIERPEGIVSTKIPNCQIGEGQERKPERSSAFKNKEDYVCVSWGKLIYVYRLVASNTQMEKIELDFILEQPSGIHNMQFINNGILVTLDNRQVYRVINLQESKQKLKEGSKQVKGEHVNVTQLEAETIYQRYLKDKQGKYLKSYSNTIVSCSYNPRYKQIFLISKNSIYRGRLEKWTDYIHYLLTQQKSWELALKLCVQLYKGNYQIFAEPFLINKTTISLLCDIGRIFFKQRMKEIDSMRKLPNSIEQIISQAKQLFEITIEFFCTIECDDFLFTNVYKSLKQNYYYLYEEQFINCLQPFIQQSQIHRIPNRDIFIRIVQFYSKKPQLLNTLIISLNEQSLYFSDIVQICTREKLFQSLSYICSVNGDFISPANKIIAHLELNPDDKVQYNNLKKYLSNLIQLKYPNDKPITDRRDSMLAQLSIWLGCDETLQYMIKHYADDYFDMLSELGKRLLNFDLVNEVPPLANQVMKKLDFIRKSRLLPRLVYFLVQVGLSSKIHYSQQLLKSILDACIQLYDTYNSAELCKQFKYTGVLRFLQKYLLQKHESIKPIRDEYEPKILPKINIWVRLTYKMFSGAQREQLLKQQPQLLRNDDPGRDASVGYIFNNASRYIEIINKYQDLLIQWSPEQSLLHIIQEKGSAGIKQINVNVMKITDEKLRYAVVRKILKMLRNRNRQFSLNEPSHEVRQIVGVSIKGLNIPSMENLATQIMDATLSDRILLFYITSICKYKKEKRVFYELIQNQNEYRSVITQLAPVVKQYDYKSCMAFIYEQQLRYKQAFSEYSAVYTEYFNTNFSKLVGHEYCHGRFMAKIFHFMLNLCLKIKKQQQWAVLISVVLTPLQSKDFTNTRVNARVIDTIQKIYQIKSSKQHPFMQELSDVIEIALSSVSRQVSIGLMAIQLNKYTDLLNKTFIVNCLMSTLRGCKKRVQTYQISKKLMVTEFVAEFQQFFRINKINGSTTDNICDECGLAASSRYYNPKMQQIRFQVLKCGHGYHLTCFQKNDYKCKICTRKQYGDEQEDEKSKDKEEQQLNRKDTLDRPVQQVEPQKTQDIYKYLAFEDYIKRQEDVFDDFRKQYEGYIAVYKRK